MHTELGMARKNDKAGVTGKGSEKQVSGHSSPERIMAHLLRRLPCAHEIQSLQKVSVVVCACNPSTGEVKTGGPGARRRASLTTW